jgi:putative oxidoreductase
MRIIVGYTFMLTGWGKLTQLPQVTENFGCRMPWRYPAYSRPFHPNSGGQLAVVMVVAIEVAKSGDVDSLETRWALKKRPISRPSSGLRSLATALPPLTGFW